MTLNKQNLMRQFSDVLAKNDSMDLEEFTLSSAPDAETEFILVHPWQDETLGVLMPRDAAERKKLNAAMKNMTFPTQLTAILHDDTEILEVIWSTYRVTGTQKDIATRSFSFTWKGVERRCEFKRSSEQFLTFARHCIPIATAKQTDHRNITSFYGYANSIEHRNIESPKCFFIDCSGLNETEILEMIRHINAYMTYFDKDCPQVLIHSTNADERKITRPRHIYDVFPEKIEPQRLDQNILTFWGEAQNTSDPIMKFLLLYRLIEYAASCYVEAVAREAVVSELKRPNLYGNYDESAKRLDTIMTEYKLLEEIPRMEKMVSRLVKPDLAWKAIEPEIDYFRKSNTFDGGYSVERLLSEKCGFENWRAGGVVKTLKTLRGIRNGVAHGRDQHMKGMIRPTRRNFALIQPWVNVIEIFAGEVMLEA